MGTVRVAEMSASCCYVVAMMKTYAYSVAMLGSKLVRPLDQQDISYLETLGPLVAPSLRSGCHRPGPSGL